MHELGVVFQVIRHVEAVAAENRVEKVSAVVLELGEVSTVIPSSLIDCWNWAVRRSAVLDGAELRIEPIEAVTQCRGCGGTYPTVAHGRTCPLCGSEDTYLLQGNEFIIKQIEIDQEPPGEPSQ